MLALAPCLRGSANRPWLLEALGGYVVWILCSLRRNQDPVAIGPELMREEGHKEKELIPILSDLPQMAYLLG